MDAVRAQVGGARVLCALSGGVDSAVAAALVHRAIGDQLTCVFVDTGLMRSGEADQVDLGVPTRLRLQLEVPGDGALGPGDPGAQLGPRGRCPRASP